MNRLLLLLILTSTNSFCQISITNVTENNDYGVYDSLNNFVGENYKQLIGQELYLKPKHKDLRKYGYDYFYRSLEPSNITSTANKFKCCDSYNSKYNALQGKNFKVIDAVADKKSYSKYGYLKLEMIETGEETYFRYDTEYDFNFPFVIMGHFNKLKEQYLDEEVLVRTKKVINIDSGQEMPIITGEYHKVIDVTLDAEYFTLSLILQNNEGAKFLYDVELKDRDPSRIVFKEVAEIYKKKYGQEDWKKILNGKVVTGWSEEMVILSWGKPEDINRASYGDQWIYDNQYLYFKDGFLTSFN
jgi:hypothetical protein